LGARIGPGKAKLLESIRDTGSISAAVRDMGMSYKRTWPIKIAMTSACPYQHEFALAHALLTKAPGHRS